MKAAEDFLLLLRIIKKLCILHAHVVAATKKAQAHTNSSVAYIVSTRTFCFQDLQMSRGKMVSISILYRELMHDPLTSLVLFS